MLSAKTVLLNRAEHISLVFDVGRGPSAFGDCCWRKASHPPTVRGDAGSDRAAAGTDGNRGGAAATSAAECVSQGLGGGEVLQRWARIWDHFGRGVADRGWGRPGLKPV